MRSSLYLKPHFALNLFPITLLPFPFAPYKPSCFVGKYARGKKAGFHLAKMEEEDIILSAFSAPLPLLNCAQGFPYNFEHGWAYSHQGRQGSRGWA